MTIPKKERFFIYGALIFAFFFSFYFLHLGPHLAKKDCVEQANDIIMSDSGGTTFEEAYNLCVLRKGLK